MAQTLVLGFEPIDITVLLSWGGEWVQTFVKQDASGNPSDFADGEQVFMRFYASDDEDASPSVEWEADLDGNGGVWDRSPADVLEVLHAQAKHVRIHYVRASGVPRVWAKGRYVKE